MMTRKLIPLGLAGLVGLGVACSDESLTDDPATGTQAQQMVVFHTTRGVFAAKVDEHNRDKLFVKVRDFYPAACIDQDEDRDRVPACLDDDSDDDYGRHRAHRSDDAGADAGVDDAADADAGVADAGAADAGDDQVARRCKRCNRGPGNAGDFRLRIDGQRVELQRGRVFSVAGNELTVPIPGDRTLTVVVGPETELRGVDMEKLVGAEVRVKKGKLLSENPLAVLAGELEVLCPGPRPMPHGELPPDAEPLPTDGGEAGVDAGTPDVDAGTPDVDAGTPDTDGGVIQ